MAKNDTLATENKISKSELIRLTREDNPEAGPTEIAKMILEKHGVKVSPAMVSTVSSLDKTRGGKPAHPGRPANVKNKTATRQNDSGVSVEMLLKVKQMTQEVGGVENAKKALDALSQLIA